MNPWRGLGGLPRTAWLLALATFVNRAGTMGLPFLALYAVKRLGVAPGRAGLTLLAYGLGAMSAGVVSGRLTDRLGPMPVMRGSLLATGLLLLAFPALRGFGTVLAAVFLWALVSESFRPANLSILSDLVGPERRKDLFVLNRLAINLGMSLGPALGGFLASRSYTALYWTDGLTSLLSFAVLATLAVPAHAAGPSPGGGSGGLGSALRDRRLQVFLLGMLPVAVVFLQHEGPMPVHLVERLSLDESFYGSLFTLNTVLVVLLEVRVNGAMAHWPAARTLALGSFLCAAGFGALAVVRGPWSVMATVVVWTFGEMILMPALADHAAELAPPARRGATMGLFSMTFSLAMVLGPWTGMALYARWGPQVLWGTMLLLGLVSTLVLGRTRAPEAPEPAPEPAP